MTVGALMLAAGSSSRMGQPKQLLEIGGEPLLRRSARAVLASKVDRTLVVLGCEAQRCAAALGGLPVEIAVHAEWREGLASTLREGLKRLSGCGAIVVCVCDQPHLCGPQIDKLIEKHERDGAAVVASKYEGAIGTPALFGNEWITRLTTLQGDKGARALFEEAGAELSLIPFPGGERDLDTWADFLRLGRRV